MAVRPAVQAAAVAAYGWLFPLVQLQQRRFRSRRGPGEIRISSLKIVSPGWRRRRQNRCCSGPSWLLTTTRMPAAPKAASPTSNPCQIRGGSAPWQGYRRLCARRLALGALWHLDLALHPLTRQQRAAMRPPGVFFPTQQAVR